MDNVIYTCLEESHKKFVMKNARRDQDILPLCTYVRQLEAAGRPYPKNDSLNDEQLDKIRSCYHLTVPEPGTNFGILMCKTFLQPKQQNNFDVKKLKGVIEKENDREWNFYSNPSAKEEVERFMATSKYEMLLSIKNMAIVYMSFVLKSHTGVTIDDFRTISEKLLPFTISICVKEISVDEIYFIVYVRKTMEDHFLETMYGLPDVDFLKLIFTSDRLFFSERDLYITNSMNFLYCFLTDRYKPEKECENDDICIYMAKLISTITFEMGGKSLKRNGQSKCGIGPLAFVISEAGILETAKINGTLDYPDDDNGDRKKRFYINSPFERMFLNLPVKNGVLYPQFSMQKK